MSKQEKKQQGPPSKIKIEKGIELPPRTNGPSKYPFHEMEIGDSFAVLAAEAEAVASSASHYRRTHKDFRITRRTLPNGTVRFWRIET